VDDGHEEIVEPLRLCALLERDVDRPTHAAEVVDDRRGLRREDCSCDHAAALLADGCDGGCLVDIERDILG
jgi:hypothetical protein